MSLYERYVEKVSAGYARRLADAATGPRVSRFLERSALPASLGAGALIGAGMGSEGEGFLDSVPAAMTAGSLLGSGMYLMSKKPVGRPWATRGQLGDLTNRFFEHGTAAGFAAAPAFAAGSLVRRGRDDDE